MERYAIDLFDGHCDAVFLRYLSGGGLRRNDGHVDLERMGKYRRCAQFFALFGEPEPTPVRDLSGKTHRELFLEEYALFERRRRRPFGRGGGRLSSRWRGRSCWTAPWSGWRRPTPWGFGPSTPHGTTSTPSPARMQRSRSGG